jgi:WD40 repeat protein
MHTSFLLPPVSHIRPCGTASLSDPDTAGVESVAFDSSTTTIAAADGNGRVYLWLYKLTDTLQDPASNSALSVAYSPDDTHLAIASASGNIYIRQVTP